MCNYSYFPSSGLGGLPESEDPLPSLVLGTSHCYLAPHPLSPAGMPRSGSDTQEVELEGGKDACANDSLRNCSEGSTVGQARNLIDL